MAALVKERKHSVGNWNMNLISDMQREGIIAESGLGNCNVFSTLLSKTSDKVIGEFAQQRRHGCQGKNQVPSQRD